MSNKVIKFHVILNNEDFLLRKPSNSILRDIIFSLLSDYENDQVKFKKQELKQVNIKVLSNDELNHKFNFLLNNIYMNSQKISYKDLDLSILKLLDKYESDIVEIKNYYQNEIKEIDDNKSMKLVDISNSKISNFNKLNDSGVRNNKHNFMNIQDTGMKTKSIKFESNKFLNDSHHNTINFNFDENMKNSSKKSFRSKNILNKSLNNSYKEDNSVKKNKSNEIYSYTDKHDKINDTNDNHLNINNYGESKYQTFVSIFSQNNFTIKEEMKKNVEDAKRQISFLDNEFVSTLKEINHGNVNFKIKTSNRLPLIHDKKSFDIKKKNVEVNENNYENKVKVKITISNFLCKSSLYAEIDRFLRSIGESNSYLADNEIDKIYLIFKDPEIAYLVYSLLNNLKKDNGSEFFCIYVELQIMDYNFVNKENEHPKIIGKKDRKGKSTQFYSKEDFINFRKEFIENSLSKMKYIKSKNKQAHNYSNDKEYIQDEKSSRNKNPIKENKIIYNSVNVSNHLNMKNNSNFKKIDINSLKINKNKNEISIFPKNINSLSGINEEIITKEDQDFIKSSLKKNSHTNVNKLIDEICEHKKKMLKGKIPKDNLWILLKETSTALRQKLKNESSEDVSIKNNN